MSRRQNIQSIGLGILLGIVVSGFLSFWVPSVYESKGKLLFHRNPVEIPSLVPEESKNRWAWVRDGFALEELALSDEALKNCESKENSLTQLRKIVRAQFATGDNFTLTITTRFSSAELAQDCANKILLFVKSRAETFAVSQLAKANESLKNSRFKEEASAALKVEEIFSKARIEILRQPIVEPNAVWPNRPLFLAMGAFLGGVLAWLILLYKQRN